VRQMPFCRAGIGHRLDRLILGRQIGRQRFALAPYGLEPLERGLAIRAAGLLSRSIIKQFVPQALLRCSR
jgi:hypothetical protein